MTRPARRATPPLEPLNGVADMSIHARIAELGITLPEPAKPVASYVAYVRTGNQVLILSLIHI